MIQDFCKKNLLGIAVCLIGGNKEQENIAQLYKSGLPFLTLESYLIGSMTPHVISDEKKCVDTALDYLFARGHQNIALVTTTPDRRMSSFTTRKACFLQNLVNRGVHRERVNSSVIHANPKRLLAAISGLYKENPAPTAFCCEGWMAGRLIDCLYTNGLKVPNDVEIVALSDSPAEVQIPSVVTDTYKIGRIGAEQLVRMIESNGKLDIKIKVPPRAELYSAGTPYYGSASQMRGDCQTKKGDLVRGDEPIATQVEV